MNLAASLVSMPRFCVFAVAEGFDQDRIVGQMCENAQLDLRVVGRKEQAAGTGDEGGADFAAELGADGNVLEIRIRRAQAPGRGAGLVEARMQPACGRMNEPRQDIGIGGFQLRKLAVLEHFLRQFVSERQLF